MARASLGRIEIELAADATFSARRTAPGGGEEYDAGGTWHRTGDRLTLETLLERGKPPKDPDPLPLELRDGRLHA